MPLGAVSRFERVTCPLPLHAVSLPARAVSLSFRAVSLPFTVISHCLSSLFHQAARERDAAGQVVLAQAKAGEWAAIDWQLLEEAGNGCAACRRYLEVLGVVDDSFAPDQNDVRHWICLVSPPPALAKTRRFQTAGTAGASAEQPAPELLPPPPPPPPCGDGVGKRLFDRPVGTVRVCAPCRHKEMRWRCSRQGLFISLVPPRCVSARPAATTRS